MEKDKTYQNTTMSKIYNVNNNKTADMFLLLHPRNNIAIFKKKIHPHHRKKNEMKNM